ncbi:MAG TPA: response regulator [Chitinophagaceae bacterium]|jgi:signal transduction histidine kinase/DNA-binding response OmpR family regulator|nr:response regulator [Chitinophagaceae bacterium]
MSAPASAQELYRQIEELLRENALLRRDFSNLYEGDTVSVPEVFKPVFDVAQQTVSEYFRYLKMDPTRGTIEINDQRYLLIRASALSKDFLDTIQSLYADRGTAEAMAIGKNFLFDIAHVIGMNDAKNFHSKMNLTDPIAKLSAGPVHFAWSGWAYVDILPESNPSPDENFYLFYNHPYSFEADSWVRSGKRSETPVCIMNAGYSSGWCEESFGLQLTAAEVSCIAKGDEKCTFIMSPPHKIQEHLERFHTQSTNRYYIKEQYEVPTFFERKRVEEEMQKSRILAEESAKSKSDFVANMSHELRTPLGAILGFTELLKKTDLSVVQKDYLEAINSSGNNLLSIINDILDLSKLDAGKFIIENVPFSIPELVHSVEVMFMAKARKKNLQFTCRTDPAIDTVVSGDPMRLTQILMNLIGNAIKFTEKGGVYVDCSIENEDEQKISILFRIRDTGIGIPEEKTSTVFERFTQADTDITRKYGGTGLGLAITKELVELQGGTIFLKSGPEQGAEFYFTLAYTKAPGQVPVQSSPDQQHLLHFDSPKKILIVEDNLMNQKLAAIILGNNGFETVIADNGSKAIGILRKHNFDLILMDIQMPVMDGYRTTQVLRDELHISTPVIAMTAHALSGEKEKCIKAGMNDYLSKPFKENDLLLKIGHWLADTDATPGNKTAGIKEGIIDLSFLMTQVKNNRTFITEMVDIFIQQTPKDVATLQQAIQENDHKTVYKTAHTLRNTIGYFGLVPVVGNELMQIEKLSHAGTGMDEIRVLFAIIKTGFEKSVAELEQLDIATLV